MVRSLVFGFVIATLARTAVGAAAPMPLKASLGPQLGTACAALGHRGLIVPELGLRTGLSGVQDGFRLNAGLGSPRFFLFEDCGRPGYGFGLSFDALFGYDVGGVFIGGIAGIGYKPVRVDGPDGGWTHNLVSQAGLALVVPLGERLDLSTHVDFQWIPPLQARAILPMMSVGLTIEVLFSI